MTREQAESLAKRLSIGPGGFDGWQIVFHAKKYDNLNAWAVEAVGHWANRDGNGPMVVWSVCPSGTFYDLYGEKVFLEFFSNEILIMIRHEWREAFRVDGKSVIEPHPEEQSMSQSPGKLAVDEARELMRIAKTLDLKGLSAGMVITEDVIK